MTFFVLLLHECAKFRVSRVIAGLMGLAPLSHRPFVGPKFFPVGISIGYRNPWFGNTIIIYNSHYSTNILKTRSSGFERAQYCNVNQI